MVGHPFLPRAAPAARAAGDVCVCARVELSLWGVWWCRIRIVVGVRTTQKRPSPTPPPHKTPQPKAHALKSSVSESSVPVRRRSPPAP